MPEQKPISSIISRSYSVRILMRCASSSLPRFSNQAMRSPSSSRMARMARLILSSGVTNCLAGKMMTAERRLRRFAGQRLEAGDALDFVAEEFDAQAVLGAGGAQLDHVAAHAELAALEGDVVARVLQIDQPGRETGRG